MPGHVPVLTEEAVRLLVTNPSGTYVDATLGQAGHSAAILAGLGAEGRLIAFDCDPRAVAYAEALAPAPPPRFLARRARFSEISPALAELGVDRVDGLLADLGISSEQLDDPARGLSFSLEGPLDMRLDPDLPLTADGWIRSVGDEELLRILTVYGETPRARAAIRAIRAAAAAERPLTTVGLRRALEPIYRGPERPRRLAQIFQALRIAVNHELDELKALLDAAPRLIRSGGTLCVISYHSLEDRLVKTAIRPPRPSDPRAPVPTSPWTAITKRPLRASEEECRVNPRARSARLRAALRRQDRP
jgi:16S rRNA (cytosine1402-N4)-methyltransferase